MIYGFNSFGYEGFLFKVETEVKDGVPSIDTVGLADSCVSSTRKLVRTAIEQSGFEIPQKRILVSLSPVDLKKEGDFSLPIALSLLAESKNNDVLVMGVLETDGNIFPRIEDTFAACQNARRNGIKYAVLPRGSVVPCGIKVYEASSLKEAADAMTSLNIGDDSLFEEKNVSKKSSTDDNILFNDVTPDLKQEFDKTENNNLKFAVAVAIAGRHHTLVFSNPYYSRINTLSIIQPCFQMLLPRLSADENNVVSRIYSRAGLYRQDVYERPVRMPHKTISIEGMFGGGPKCSPGEITLAHNGVLFLEDAAEFRTSVLQILRVPLSTGNITLSRAGRSTIFPSKFQLFMMTSPCLCGNFGSKEKLCLCSRTTIETFRKKLEFPLGDRLAIRINTDNDDNPVKNFTLEELRSFISTAWKRQLHRQGKLNQDLSLDEAFDLKISDEARAFFEEATEGFSVGRKAEILKLAQTLNDISDDYSDELQKNHIREAIKLNGKNPVEA